MSNKITRLKKYTGDLIRSHFELFFIIVSGMLTLLWSLYMIYIHAPNVVKIRPELKDVDLVTGIFAGRPFTYLFYHHPIIATVGACALIVLPLGLAILSENKN